jgi:hypothetical protein
VADTPFRTSIRRNPDDPRTLLERISAQVLERLEEAVDMAGLHLLVELRKVEGRAPPQPDSAHDRKEFEACAAEILVALRTAFSRDLSLEQCLALEEAERAGDDERSRLLAGQGHLARRLPDYWQRFEAYRAAYQDARLAGVLPRSWLKRLLPGKGRR